MTSSQIPPLEARVKYASFNDTLELVEAIANKWDRKSLNESEQWLLKEWERSAARVVKYYLARFGGIEEVKLDEKRPFPELEFNRLNEAIESINHAYGPRKPSSHNKPSDLRFFMAISPDKLKTLGITTSPKIHPLVVEIGLDLIGLRLFESWRRTHPEWNSMDLDRRRAFVKAYIKFAHPQLHDSTTWWTLRGQLAVALTGNNFRDLDATNQSRVVKDLTETSEKVRKHQITPEQFRDKVVKCVQENISSPDLVDFGEVTRGLLIDSKLYPVDDEGKSQSSTSTQAELTHRKRYIYGNLRFAASYR